MEPLKKMIAVAMVCLCGRSGYGQSLIRPGLVSTQLTLAPAIAFDGTNAPFYLHGGLEVFFSEKVSFEGSAFLSLGSMNGGSSFFEYNHSLFWGANYHFTRDNHDFYIGAQPGLSFTKNAATAFDNHPPIAGVNPMLSATMGYQFFFFKFMHFFVQSRLVLGQHHFDFARDLGELRFSAGLGFNLNALRPR